MKIDAVADVHKLFIVQERKMFSFLQVKYPQAIITLKLMTFIVLYTATMKGC